MIDGLLGSLSWLAAGCAMLHYLWVGGIIGLLALVGRRVLRRAPLRVNYAFMLCCLLILAVAPAGLFVQIVDRMNRPVSMALGPEAMGDEMLDEELSLLIGNASSLGIDEASTGAVSSTVRERGSEINRGSLVVTGLSPVLPWLWLAGAPVLLVMVLFGLVGAHRLRQRASSAESSPVVSLCDQLAAEVGLPKVPVAMSRYVTSPTVVGIWRPVILLPTGSFEQWREDDLKMVLLHELWHVKRQDNLVNLLQRIIESILFFHPVVWQVSRWIRADREHCCDTAVLHRTEHHLAYAKMLAKLATGRCRHWGPLAAAMGEHNLVARIQHVLNYRKRSSSLFSAPAAWMLLVVGSASVFAASIADPAFIAVPSAGVLTLDHGGTGVGGRSVEMITPAEEVAWVSVDAPEITETRAPSGVSPAGAIKGVRVVLVDEAGEPVSHAQIGIRVKWNQVQREAGATPSSLARSDADGVFWIDSEDALRPLSGCDPTVPVFAFHEERQLAGSVSLTAKDWGQAAEVVMRPVSRVRFRLDSEEVRQSGRSLTWGKGFIRLPKSRVSYLLRDTQNHPFEFEYLLPPGNYEVVGFAGDGDYRETLPAVNCFKVRAGRPFVDLGVIQLASSPNRAAYRSAKASETGVSTDGSERIQPRPRWYAGGDVSGLTGMAGSPRPDSESTAR